jgi:hypothetical protein
MSVVAGYVVRVEHVDARGKKRVKDISRTFAVRSAAEVYAELYRKVAPGAAVWVSEVTLHDDGANGGIA